MMIGGTPATPLSSASGPHGAAAAAWARFLTPGGHALPRLAYPQRPLPNVLHRIAAFAGCGKTTLLMLLARAHPDLRILYLAYNNNVIRGAKACMPSNVLCSTSHSLTICAYQ